MNTDELPDAVATALAEAGATAVFGMPGGGNNLDFIGAVERSGMRFVLAHAETPATIMAAVYGDVTNTPGACVVTRGPGAASGVNGVANALLDRQQLVYVTDAVSAEDYERISHQRLDQRALFGPVTKWSATVGGRGAYETAQHAVRISMAQPPGPVHLDYDPSAESTPSSHMSSTVSAPEDVERALALVANAHRPVVLLGVGARHHEKAVRNLLAGSHAPVLTTYRAKGVIGTSSDTYAGLLTGATAESPALDAADVIVMIGVDTVELIPNNWPYIQPVVSFAAWADDSPYLQKTEEVIGDLEVLLAQLAPRWPATTWEAGAGKGFHEHELERLLAARPTHPDGVAPQDVVLQTRAAAPAGTIATVDAGAHMLPAMILWDTEEPEEILISSGLATMGFALPAAIAAAVARPEQHVVAFTGDGGLGMCLGELETLSRLGLKVTVVVFNDARLSLIAIKAKPIGNGGDNAVAYTDTDFAAVARGYGITAESAHSTEELDACLERAFRAEGPRLIDVRVDPTEYKQLLATVRGARP